jgi:hypothetical protein
MAKPTFTLTGDAFVFSVGNLTATGTVDVAASSVTIETAIISTPSPVHPETVLLGPDAADDITITGVAVGHILDHLMT